MTRAGMFFDENPDEAFDRREEMRTAYAEQQFLGECECWLEDHDDRIVGCRDYDEGGEG
jgi:hypothetical protein